MPCPSKLGEPAKVMGPEGSQAKMWVMEKCGQKMTRIVLQKGFDWTKNIQPILPGCPDWCPATHFGYMESGEMGIQFKDGTRKTVKAGESYFIPPGHLPILETDATMIEFSQDPTYGKEFLEKEAPK